MTREHWPWAGAGERRDPQARAWHSQRLKNELEDRKRARGRDNQIAHQKWAAGLVVPQRITEALNVKGLVGPEVDEKCLATEPDVDRWEAGDLYPSWEQLVALSKLTGRTPLFFTLPSDPLFILDTSMRFHLPEHRIEEIHRDYRNAVQRYPVDVVAECPGTNAHKRRTQRD